MTDFEYSEILPLGEDTTEYRKISSEGVSTFEANGETFLKIEPEAIQLLTATAMREIAHYLRPAHLEQLSSILGDPEASPNDVFVARELLQNANIAAGGASRPSRRSRARRGCTIESARCTIHRTGARLCSPTAPGGWWPGGPTPPPTRATRPRL